MDLKEDFISIQGILLSLDKNSGVLKKIKHRGGNEVTILNVITELHTFLSSKNFIKDKTVNPVFDQQLKEIVLFLILNTELKQPLDFPEYEHLINIMPQLSTCLLANIVIGLDLSRHYCQALEMMPLDATEQLLSELIPCLKRCKPKIHLTNAYSFLQLIIIKLSVASEKDAESAEKITDIASQMLLNLTGLHDDQYKNIKIGLVHECMGLTLLNLLNLLLLSNEKNGMLSTIIEKLAQTCCSIMKAVTIDVFCSWAELVVDDQTLQVLIAGKSYMFIEKYQKHAASKELISMLGTIAQKPKTVHELIHAADTPTMISMVNKADINQKLWMLALLNTQVLKCKDTINCVSRWAHLCTSEDVTRLLNMSIHTKEPSAKKLVIKCASTLDLNELIYVTTRHFFQNGIGHSLNDDIQQQLVLLFNKIKDKDMGEEFAKELHLLLLQNPEETLSYIFAECLKNTFYLHNLKRILPSMKEVASVNDIGIKILNREISNNNPTEHNIKNYTQLFNTLVEIDFYSIDVIVLTILLPLSQNLFSEKNYELLRFNINILNNLGERLILKEETECVFNFLFDVITECRCKFFDFNIIKQELVKECVNVIEKYHEMNLNSTYQKPVIKEEDIFVSFYKNKMFGADSSASMLKHLFPESFENHAETVCYMMKVLPLCVTPEWKRICSELTSRCGVVKAIEFLCDTLILLCQLVNSQESKNAEVNCMSNDLKYNIQNFGIVVKECIQKKIRNLDEDVILTKNVCRLLRFIPPGNVKSEEGLSLASLLSDMSLSSLKTDKKFACLVASIQEPHICKMLAQNMLNKSE